MRLTLNFICFYSVFCLALRADIATLRRVNGLKIEQIDSEVQRRMNVS